MKHYKLNKYLLSLAIALCMGMTQAATDTKCYLVAPDIGKEDGSPVYLNRKGEIVDEKVYVVNWREDNTKNVVDILSPSLHHNAEHTNKDAKISSIAFNHSYCIRITRFHDKKHIQDKWNLTHNSGRSWTLELTLDPYYSSMFSKSRKTTTHSLMCETTNIETPEVTHQPVCTEANLTQEQKDGLRDLSLFY